tara:strand:+ start:178624 stop:178755 length:132 start_codon:yes stop_codon:yes gene_type:complete
MEKVFDRIAKENMVEWDLEDFKKTHPTLFKTIIQSMRVWRNIG